MIDFEELIKSINKNCKNIFGSSDFYLQLSKARTFRISGSPMSIAVNRHNNDAASVNVLHWFDDFWIFIEIKSFPPNTHISISIFQGKATDEVKGQLLRAEWDDFNNPEEEHPQPHWHITTDFAIEETFREFSEDLDDGQSFETFEAAKTEIINVKNMHFAMVGNWQDSKGHVHPINDEEKILKWFQGVLLHLRTQLQYVK
ncbi:MAG: hypothetical protein H6581_01985 [Bacteroidia bacterium]|nr:hypothetical protein [Bacteroidia bacterium]